ncbi:hypothetical protein QBC46DRAFT_272075 [Diplogelasinospora grovesii]|uniref:Uncharacterized protein n=1 Tax=Diplogelasinospora grovesii TaxID=303347 RepID=A0AAN6RZX1_9PEZI|nr:hypothetical protein QBC46DRAFT_272075 [Diplogelasinospora grovesii]
MPAIPPSPSAYSENGDDGISPVLSRAPPAPATATKADGLGIMQSRVSAIDDRIPEEHKRVPGLLPRSPLLTVSNSIRGYRAKRAGRKPAPPPIVIHPSTPSLYRKGPESGMESVTIQTPMTAKMAKPKRKTVWGMIEGWWDLGLLERMGTVKKREQR